MWPLLSLLVIATVLDTIHSFPPVSVAVRISCCRRCSAACPPTSTRDAAAPAGFPQPTVRCPICGGNHCCHRRLRLRQVPIFCRRTAAPKKHNVRRLPACTSWMPAERRRHVHLPHPINKDASTSATHALLPLWRRCIITGDCAPANVIASVAVGYLWPHLFQLTWLTCSPPP